MKKELIIKFRPTCIYCHEIVDVRTIADLFYHMKTHDKNLYINGIHEIFDKQKKDYMCSLEYCCEDFKYKITNENIKTAFTGDKMGYWIMRSNSFTFFKFDYCPFCGSELPELYSE